MRKFYGAVGYIDLVESTPGVWSDSITERYYYGDVTKNTKRQQDGQGLNDDLVVNNIISVIADPYAYQNFHAIKYVEWMGSKWQVNTVEVRAPRLIMTIGGVYNG